MPEYEFIIPPDDWIYAREILEAQGEQVSRCSTVNNKLIFSFPVPVEPDLMHAIGVIDYVYIEPVANEVILDEE